MGSARALHETGALPFPLETETVLGGASYKD